jgi:hypothetical protein
MTRWDALIVFTLGLLTVAHYTVPTHVLWIHILLFWLFQVPILIGGFTRGVRGGLSTAIVATVLLFPHAVGLSRHHGLSANTIWMDLASLYVIGLATGWLRDRWRKEQEMGERIRELTNVDEILHALRRELQGPVSSIRGLLYSLDPFQRQQPGVVPAIRALDASFSSIENLNQRLQVIRVDSKMRLVGLDRILASAQKYLHGVTYPTPMVTLEWRCAPPRIPASNLGLSSSLASLILHLTPPAVGVWVIVSKAPGWVVIELRPMGTDLPPSFSQSTCSLAIASQVIRAHGGRVEDHLGDLKDPRLRVCLPTVLRIRLFRGQGDGVPEPRGVPITTARPKVDSHPERIAAPLEEAHMASRVS